MTGHMKEERALVAGLVTVNAHVPSFEGGPAIPQGAIVVPVFYPYGRPVFWLMQYRQGPPEVNGKWAFPGGKLNANESAHDAAVREFGEETGQLPIRSRFEPFGPRSIHERPDGSLFIMNYFIIELNEKRDFMKRTEPEKHGPWQQFTLHNLPTPIAPSGEIAIGRYMTSGRATL